MTDTTGAAFNGEEQVPEAGKPQFLNKNLIDDLVRQTGQERKLDKDEVMELVEEAFARVLARNNDRKGHFRVSINADTLEVRARRLWEVIPDDELITDVEAQKTLEFAREIEPQAKVGGEVSMMVAVPDTNSYSNASIFKQNYRNCLRQAEHGKLLEELLGRHERLLTGTVKRIDKSSQDYLLEAHRVECRLRRVDSIPKDNLRTGDRVRCIIKEIREDPNRGRIVYVSRTSDEYLRELFRREVPEIEKGILEIVGVARDPGYRAKISVRSRDPKVDPVGTCVGMRGSRVQAVTNELGGEKVDIIPWDEDEVNFVLHALSPAEVKSIHVTGPESCDVIVDEDKLAPAIGKSGMNVKLAARLTGWQINITNAADAEQREQERIQRKQEYFMTHLDVDEDVARILYDEGFNTVQDIIDTPHEEMVKDIEGFDEDTVDELRTRAAAAIEAAEKDYQLKLVDVDPQLREVAKVDEILRILVDNDVVTLQQLADLDLEQLMELSSNDLSEEEANELIMAARKALDMVDSEPAGEEGGEAK